MKGTIIGVYARSVEQEMSVGDGPCQGKQAPILSSNLQGGKSRYLLCDRVIQLKEPTLVEHHHGQRGDGLGHRPDGEEGPPMHRSIMFQVALHGGLVDHLPPSTEPEEMRRCSLLLHPLLLLTSDCFLKRDPGML